MLLQERKSLDFQKTFDFFLTFYRLTKLISRAIQIIMKTAYRQNVLRPGQIFEQKNVLFRHFLENFDHKMRFWRALPLKISIYWRQIRRWNNFKAGQPKMDFIKKVAKGGSFGSSGGRIHPQRKANLPPPPPSPQSAPDHDHAGT